MNKLLELIELSQLGGYIEHLHQVLWYWTNSSYEFCILLQIAVYIFAWMQHMHNEMYSIMGISLSIVQYRITSPLWKWKQYTRKLLSN